MIRRSFQLLRIKSPRKKCPAFKWMGLWLLSGPLSVLPSLAQEPLPSAFGDERRVLLPINTQPPGSVEWVAASGGAASAGSAAASGSAGATHSGAAGTVNSGSTAASGSGTAGLEEVPPIPTGTGLLLLTDVPFEAQRDAFLKQLRTTVKTPTKGEVYSSEAIYGKVGHDPGAWRQSATFARAALWFTLARQGLLYQEDAQAMRGLRRTRELLEQGGLMARAPLLASIELMAGRILVDQGAYAEGEQAFRTAVLIDPNDVSEQLPDGVARQLYEKARHWVQEAPRLPMRVDVSTEAAGETTLYVNGARVQSGGPQFLIELPPGRHFVAAVREGSRPDAKGVLLEEGKKKPEVFLRLEPGAGASLTLKPFALAEVNSFLEKCELLMRRAQVAQLVIGVAARAEAWRRTEQGPKMGIQTGLRVNPGPDEGESTQKEAPVMMEYFRLELSGRVVWLGSDEK
ncbi:MAG: hypothetical protein ACKO6N_29800 [Myxococcota bacterium]